MGKTRAKAPIKPKLDEEIRPELEEATGDVPFSICPGCGGKTTKYRVIQLPVPDTDIRQIIPVWHKECYSHEGRKK